MRARPMVARPGASAGGSGARGSTPGRAEGPLPSRGKHRPKARPQGRTGGSGARRKRKETRSQHQDARQRAECGTGTSDCQAHVVRNCGRRRTEGGADKEAPACRRDRTAKRTGGASFERTGRSKGREPKGRERRKDAVSSGAGKPECQQQRQWGPAAMPAPIWFGHPVFAPHPEPGFASRSGTKLTRLTQS